jgi:hypothetical protein
MVKKGMKEQDGALVQADLEDKPPEPIKVTTFTTADLRPTRLAMRVDADMDDKPPEPIK